MANDQKPVISVRKLRKVYMMGQEHVVALHNIDLDIPRGEVCCIFGTSGSGKSTLLNQLAGLEKPTRGVVRIGGVPISQLNENQLAAFRQKHIGFVFQFYNLVPNLTALENVELASQICPDHFDPVDTLHKVGLGDRLSNFPAQLSGGEQQRVSIARAIAKKPKLLLCDEPTGALDYETGKEVLQLLQDICRDENMTVLIITHNSALAPMAHKVVRFRSGKVVGEDVNPAPTPIADIEW